MTRLERLLRWGSLVTAVGSCRPEPAPEPPPVAGMCLLAQERLQELGCGTTTVEGAPFAVACELAAAAGVDWHPEAIAQARRCL